MLRWIVRKNLIRLYDVLAIIIFSAAVNVLIGGLIDSSIKCVIYYVFLLLSFGSLGYSGWCFYWLFESTKFYLQEAADVEIAAINKIAREGKSSQFLRYFWLSIIFAIAGFIFFILGVYFRGEP